ncbi:hypothetical protein P9109_12230, partial [Gallibacterium anatis]|uniref:hypothetical protein n=1 Tax=Gallibacterium anatis TaxID=750 RepID=UPI003004459A
DVRYYTLFLIFCKIFLKIKVFLIKNRQNGAFIFDIDSECFRYRKSDRINAAKKYSFGISKE